MNDEGKLGFGVGLDTNGLKVDAEKVKAILKGIGDDATAQSSRIDNSFSMIGKGLALAGGTAGLTMLGKQILDTTALFEKFGIVLRNTLGEKKGTEALDMIAEFAATTPFQLDEITGSFIKMANQGFVPTREEMVKLGDVASSTGKSFDQLAEAILDAQVGEFERLKEFGIKASKSGDEVTFMFKEQATTVKNNNQAIREYILSLGELEGVQGANAKISASLTGMISNLSDKLSAAFNEIGTDNKDLLYGIVGAASTIIDNYEMVGKVLMGLVATYGAYKTAVILSTVATNGLTLAESIWYAKSEALLIINKALNATMLSNPYVAVATAVMAVVSALAIYYTTANKVSEQERLMNETKEKVNSEIAKETINLKALENRIVETEPKSKERVRLVKELKEMYPDLLQGIDAESASVNVLKNALSGYVEKLSDSIRLKVLYGQITETINSLETEKDYTKRTNLQSQLKTLEKEYEYQQLVVKYGKENADIVSKEAELRTKLNNLSLVTTVNYETFAASWRAHNEQNHIIYKNAKAEQTALNEAYNKRVEETKNVAEQIKQVNADLAKIEKIKTGEVGAKEGDEKVIDGAKYVFRSGKWQKVKLSSAELKALKANEKIVENEEYNALKTYNKAISDATIEAQNMEIENRRSHITDKKELIKFDYEQQIATINAEEARLKSTLVTYDKKGNKVEVKDANGNPVVFNSAPFDKMRTEAKNKMNNDIENYEQETLNNQLEKYKTFTARKKQIDDDYEKAKILKESNPEAFIIATKEHEDALKNLQKDLLEVIGLQDVYQDNASDFLTAKVKAVMPFFTDLAHATKTQLSEVKKIISGIEVTPEQKELLKSLGMTEEQIDQLLAKLKKLKEEGNKSVDDQRWKGILEDINAISSSVASLGNTLEKMGGVVGDFGGLLSGLASSFNDLFTAITSTDPTAVITAGINGLIQMITAISDQIEKNKKIQEEWNNKIAESVFLLQKARIESLSYKEANIFGVENPYAKATAGALQYVEATKQLNEKTRELSNGQVQTGTSQEVNWGNVGLMAGGGATTGAAIGTAIGGWAFGLGTVIGAGVGALVGSITGLLMTETVPVFDDLASKYGEILQNGELNQQLLADYDLLDDKTKKLVDEWQDLKQAQEEAQKQMEENFKTLTGDLGTQLSDTLVEAFSSGDLYSAIDKFDKKVNDVIANILQQMIFKTVFQDLFTQLENDMKASFGVDENGNPLTGAQVDYNITDELEKFNEDYKKKLEIYNEMMTAADASMKQDGLTGIINTTRTATARGIATASQESVDENNGRLTAIQGHTFIIAEGVKILQKNSAIMLEYVLGIYQNTNRLEQMEESLASVQSGIETINLKGIKVLV